MTAEKFKRKLTAILSADVKGYSRLMGEDEEGTIRTLNAYLEVITGFIQQHRGRVVTTGGDSVLAEFASVVDAVRCAVEIQEELKDRNRELADNRRMEFRIGVNLGDVVEEGDNILGDGVNVAARVENLAEAGGICISGTVYDHIERKLSLSYEDLGEQTVKNIEKPVRVYRIPMEPKVTVRQVPGKKKDRPRQWQRTALSLGVVLIVVVAAVAIWRLYLRPVPPPVEVASKEKMALPLPDVPSIAVLPFVNMSEDPKQEFLSDGITDNIITALSKVPRLFVIARNSTFTYKGKPVKAKQVSEELGVRYVLEGSVQRSGDRIRINAQLIDALKGHHLWAERYDRDLKDLFPLQDEITMKIISALQVKLTVGERARLVGKGTKNLDAYLKALQAEEQRLRENKQGYTLAKELAKEALALDPKYAIPHTILAHCHILEVYLGFSESPKESIKLAVDAAEKALALDDSDPGAHGSLSFLYIMQRQYDKAIDSAKLALKMGPGEARTHWGLGRALLHACRFSESIQYLEEAIRLDPFPPSMYIHALSVSYRFVGRYEEALAQLKKAYAIAPDNLFTRLGFAQIYGTLGREEEARAAAAEVLRLAPKFSLEDYAKTLPLKDQSAVDFIIGGLRKAGLK